MSLHKKNYLDDKFSVEKSKCSLCSKSLLILFCQKSRQKIAVFIFCMNVMRNLGRNLRISGKYFKILKNDEREIFEEINRVRDE